MNIINRHVPRRCWRLFVIRLKVIPQAVWLVDVEVSLKRQQVGMFTLLRDHVIFLMDKIRCRASRSSFFSTSFCNNQQSAAFFSSSKSWEFYGSHETSTLKVRFFEPETMLDASSNPNNPTRHVQSSSLLATQQRIDYGLQNSSETLRSLSIQKDPSIAWKKIPDRTTTTSEAYRSQRHKMISASEFRTLTTATLELNLSSSLLGRSCILSLPIFLQ